MARTNKRTVPCKECGDPIPAARAALPISHGLCIPCNRDNLAVVQQDLRPEYETEVWSRGGRL